MIGVRLLNASIRDMKLLASSKKFALISYLLRNTKERLKNTIRINPSNIIILREKL